MKETANFILGIILGLAGSIPYAINNNWDVIPILAFTLWSIFTLYRLSMNLGFVTTFTFVTYFYGQDVFLKIFIISLIFIVTDLYFYSKKISQNV